MSSSNGLNGMKKMEMKYYAHSIEGQPLEEWQLSSRRHKKEFC